MDLEKQITDLNKSGKSLEAILKQLQVPSFNVQTIIFFLSIKCLAQLRHCHDQEEKAGYHLLLRENRSGLSRVNQEPPKKQLQKLQ